MTFFLEVNYYVHRRLNMTLETALAKRCDGKAAQVYLFKQRFISVHWTDPQLSIMVIYNSTWSILIQ